MAENKKGKPEKAKPKKKVFQVKKSDRTSNPKPSAETIRQLYMASPHIEWTPFAKSKNWHPITSRNNMPVDEWIKQKRSDIAREQSEVIAEMVFNHQSRWHKDVLKTFSEYPEANDALMNILKKRINDIVEVINLDTKSKQMADMAGIESPAPQFSKIKNSELLSLAAAIKVCTESKHKSLMIHDWSFKVAENYTDPKQFETALEKQHDMAWNVKLIGGDNLTSHDMQKLITKWYDHPTNPHDEDVIDAQFSAAGEG